jgi:TP901-1 family phage major tail protein
MKERIKMALSGKNGKITINSTTPITVAGMKNWSLELNVDTLETTALGDEWKKYITGLKEWTASGEGDFDAAADGNGQGEIQEAYLNGTEVDVKFYVDATHFYSGSAIISSLSIEDAVDDLVTLSIEFTGTGAVSFM